MGRGSRLDALAEPGDLAVIDRLHGAIVSVATSEGLIVLEQGLDLADLIGSCTKRAFHDEPFDGLIARGSGQRTIIGPVLATESFLQAVKINEAIDSVGLVAIAGSMVPVDILKEGVGETSFGLDVEENGNEKKIVQIRASLLLVHNVQLHGVGLAIDLVLRSSMEVELLHIVLETIARVAATNSDKAQVTSDLQRVAIVGHAQVLSKLVVVVNSVGLRRGLAITNANGISMDDVDGRLVLAGRASTTPI